MREGVAWGCADTHEHEAMHDLKIIDILIRSAVPVKGITQPGQSSIQSQTKQKQTKKPTPASPSSILIPSVQIVFTPYDSAY